MLALLAVLIYGAIFLLAPIVRRAHDDRWQNDFKVELGLDLQGGTTVTLRRRRPTARPVTDAR